MIQTPAHAQEKLKKAFDKALLDWDNIRNEAIIDVLYTPIPSKFINLLGLDREIHQDLLPLHEEWAGDVREIVIVSIILYFTVICYSMMFYSIQCMLY